MNFGEIKLGFEKYLINKQQENLLNNVGEKEDIDVSIFGNIEEFNEYLEKELNLDTSDAFELIKNINQLKKFEIVDGQLVDTGAVEEEQVQEESTDNSKTLEGEEATPENNMNEQNIVVGLLNELMQDESFAEVIDRDENGKIKEQELFEFYDAIKEYDGDDKSISLEDLVKALKDIKDGNFLYPDEIIAKEEAERHKALQEEQAQQSAQNANRSNSAGRTGGSRNVGSSSAPRAASANNASSSNNLESMSVEELEEQKTEKQEELNSARNDVNSVHNGSNDAVNSAQEDCETAKQDYTDAVKEADEELGVELETCLDNISTKEQEIDETNIAINDKKGEISTQEATISSTESNISAMKSSLSSLEGQSSDDPDRQAEIQSKISSLQTKIAEMENELAEQKAVLETKKAELSELETTLATQESELEKLNNNDSEPRGKAQIEADIAKLESNEAIMQAKENYESAKEKVETVKTQELEKANGIVATKQQELNEINTKLNEAKAKEIEKENAMNAFSMYNEEYGQNIADAASSLHPNSGFGGWCAAGVSDSLALATGREKTYGNGCDYTDVMRNRDDFMEYSDFDFDSMDAYQIQEFLHTLPSGTVVSFGATNGHPYGHVMIMDGKGNEISDGTNAIGTYYKNAYSSMSVHIPVG